MILIAHRGNVNGKNSADENHPDYLMKAVNLGFDVEVDVWFLDQKFILGHDEPQYEVSLKFLLNKNFWHHAKNLPALYQLVSNKNKNLINCFSHDTDDAVLTSQGWIWTYPGKQLTPRSIAVMPERVPGWDLSNVAGICSDYLIDSSI